MIILGSKLPLSPPVLRDFLWQVALQMRSGGHPWFRGGIERSLSREQVVLGELQHFLRVLRNHEFYGSILRRAQEAGDRDVIQIAQQNYDEEVVDPENHVELLFHLLDEAGIERSIAEGTMPTPGTALAVETILGFCERSPALEGMAFVALVEAQNAGEGGVAIQVYQALREYYGFSEKGARNFLVHSEVDGEHGSRQIELICRKATTAEAQRGIIHAVHLGVHAFSLEWDGHLQAAIGRRLYWSGDCETLLG
ncbi:MAG: iron-containing redox enzyme family protein [Acidobacteria bacterium]|nr:iron-containing redox enzyme family protein [Acidobacteriota bacterium]